jgi:hypothetical protein
MVLGCFVAGDTINMSHLTALGLERAGGQCLKVNKGCLSQIKVN